MLSDDAWVDVEAAHASVHRAESAAAHEDWPSAWVASFNEYKGKGGSDRQFWLSVWSCAEVSVDRKGGRESTYVPHPFASVVGGLPPAMLGSLAE